MVSLVDFSWSFGDFGILYSINANTRNSNAARACFSGYSAVGNKHNDTKCRNTVLSAKGLFFLPVSEFLSFTGRCGSVCLPDSNGGYSVIVLSECAKRYIKQGFQITYLAKEKERGNNMRRVRKVLGVLMALLMVVGMNPSVCANESVEGTGDTAVLFTEGVYEGEELEAIAETLGCDMVTEDGYVL